MSLITRVAPFCLLFLGSCVQNLENSPKNTFAHNEDVIFTLDRHQSIAEPSNPKIAPHYEKMFPPHRYRAKTKTLATLDNLQARYNNEYIGTGQSFARIGDMYHAGIGVQRSLPEAIKWYKKAANANNTYAQYMLSVLFLHGFGVDANLQTSVTWYKKASRAKDSLPAMLQIAHHYLHGYGLPIDRKEAYTWYKLAAEKGYLAAKTKLADLIIEDNINKQDNAAELLQAFNLYKDAGLRGDPYAEYNVGLCYLRGTGVQPNNYGAASWLQRAAFKGFRPAQYELGLLYLNSNSYDFKKNPMKAYAWLYIATKEQNEATPAILTTISKNMLPDVREKTTQLITKYEHKYAAQRGLTTINTKKHARIHNKKKYKSKYKHKRLARRSAMRY